MKIKVIQRTIILSACLICARTFAGDDTSISFTTVKGVERATSMLREKGLRAFMDEAWKQGVAAPDIHSKYWLDQFTRGKPKLYAIEKSYRDFGYEIAVQLEELAFQIYEKPDKNLEMERLEWLLRFSKWMLKPGRFENYRIGIRAEDAALMPMVRTIFNLDIPTEKIEQRLQEFLSAKENATLRADFLFEESDGVFDVRNLAQKATDGKEDGFDGEWIAHARRAYRHFDDKPFRYTTDSEVLYDEKIENNFFMDDNREFGGCDSIPGNWDEKYHKLVGVFGGHSYAVRALRDLMVFRKDIGEFPDVAVRPGQDGSDVYGRYYFNQYKKLTKARVTSVGWLYWQYKNNAYMDDSTSASYRTRNIKRITIDEFESWRSTRERRALNQQWLKKNRKTE